MSSKSSEKKSGKSGEKKQRKSPPRPERRSYKDSPAGHFADKIKMYINGLNRIGIKMAFWPGVSKIDVTGLEVLKIELDKLAEAKFNPPRRKGGGRAPLNTGMRVYLKKDAIDMLKPLFPGIETMPVFIGNGCDPKLKYIPLRANSGDLTSPPLGMVPRNWLSANPIVEATTT